MRPERTAAAAVEFSRFDEALVAASTQLSAGAAIRSVASGRQEALNGEDAPVIVGVDVDETSIGPAWRLVGSGLVDTAEATGQADIPTFLPATLRGGSTRFS